MMPLYATPTRAAPVLVLGDENTDHGHTSTAEKRGPSAPSDMEASPAPGTMSSSASKRTSRSPMMDVTTHNAAPRHHRTFARRGAPAVTGPAALRKEPQAVYVHVPHATPSPSPDASPAPEIPPSPVRSLLNAYLGTSPLPRRPLAALSEPPAKPVRDVEAQPSSPLSAPASSASSSFRRSPAPSRAYIEDFLALSDDACDATSTSPAPQRRTGMTLDHSPVVPEMWNETSSSSSSSAASSASVTSVSTAVSDGFAVVRVSQERCEGSAANAVARIDLGGSASPESPRPVSLTAPPPRGSVQRSALAHPPPHAREAAPGHDEQRPRPRHPHRHRRSQSVERTLRFPSLAEASAETGDSASDTALSEGHTRMRERTTPPSPRRDRDAQQSPPRHMRGNSASRDTASPVQVRSSWPPRTVPNTQCPSPLQTSRFQPPPVPTSPPGRTTLSISVSSCETPPPPPAQRELVEPVTHHVEAPAASNSAGSSAHASAAAATSAAPARPARAPPALVVPVEVAPGVTRSLLVDTGDSAAAAVRRFLDVYAASFHLDRRAVGPPLVRHVAAHMPGPSRLSARPDTRPDIAALLARLYPGATAHKSRGSRDTSPRKGHGGTPEAPPPLAWRLSTKVPYNPRTQALELDDGAGCHANGRTAHTRHDSGDGARGRARSSAPPPPPKAPLHTRTSLLRLEATAARQAAEAALRAELEAPAFHPTVAPHSARICQEKLRELTDATATDTTTTTAAANADAPRDGGEPSAKEGRQRRRTPTVPAPRAAASAALWGDAVVISEVSSSSSDAASARAPAVPGASGAAGNVANSPSPPRQAQGMLGGRPGTRREMATGPLLSAAGRGSRTRSSATQTRADVEASTSGAAAEATRVDAATQSLSPFARSIESSVLRRRASTSPRVGFSPTSLVVTDLSAFSMTPSTVEKTIPRVDLYAAGGEAEVDTSSAPLGSSERQQRIEERLLALDADRRRRLAAMRRFAGTRDAATGQPLFKPFTGR